MLYNINKHAANVWAETVKPMMFKFYSSMKDYQTASAFYLAEKVVDSYIEWSLFFTRW